MKIMVLSDTHGNLRSFKKVIDSIEDIDMILHLGDNVRDALKIKDMVSCPVKYVKGNTDFIDAPMEIVEEYNDKKFFITHGHKYGIKSSLSRLYYAAQEKGADVVLFGHSHVPYCEKMEDILFFNPGSIGDRRWEPNETYGIIDIDLNGKIHAEVVSV